MSDQTQTLRRLQEIDAHLFQLRSEQRQKPLALELAKQLVAEQQAKAQAIEVQLKALQIQQKEKEIELSTKEANVKKFQLQLFQVKTNKEYTAIQHEIDQTKADASLLEEDILKILEAIEQTTKNHQARLAEAANQQAHLREEEQRITQELNVLEERLAELERQRQTVVPSVTAATLSVYERVLASREGLAMVPLINDSCGGCHMMQPPQVVSEVHLNAKLTTCENCNRILYFDETLDHH